MPGPPNRPPERDQPPTPPPAAAEPPDRAVLRRLVPCHVALLQDAWKGAPSPEVIAPFEKAEAALRAGEAAAAQSALDVLSVRFAEPRWPTLPPPFRDLRVPIPLPVPPQWDPEHGLSPPEREARTARRRAEEQVTLAEASLTWAGNHGIRTDDLGSRLSEARAALAGGGVAPGFYPAIDALWIELRARLPRPKGSGAPPSPARS